MDHAAGPHRHSNHGDGKMNGMPGDMRRLMATGLTWGMVWVALALIVGTIFGIFRPGDIDPGEEPLVLAPAIGLAGFACGVVFGGLLSIFETRKTIVELPLIRVAAWGILVAAAFPLVMGKGIPEMLVIGPVGALSALASVAVAQSWARWRSRPRSPGY